MVKITTKGGGGLVKWDRDRSIPFNPALSDLTFCSDDHRFAGWGG